MRQRWLLKTLFFGAFGIPIGLGLGLVFVFWCNGLCGGWVVALSIFLDLTRNPKLSHCPFLLDHPSHAPQNYPKGGLRKWGGWQDDRRFLGEVSQSLGNFRQRHTNQNQVLCEMPQQSEINTLIAMVNHYCIDLIVFRNSFFIVMARKPLWRYILKLIYKSLYSYNIKSAFCLNLWYPDPSVLMDQWFESFFFLSVWITLEECHDGSDLMTNRGEIWYK